MRCAASALDGGVGWGECWCAGWRCGSPRSPGSGVGGPGDGAFTCSAGAGVRVPVRGRGGSGGSRGGRLMGPVRASGPSRRSGGGAEGDLGRAQAVAAAVGRGCRGGPASLLWPAVRRRDQKLHSESPIHGSCPSNGRTPSEREASSRRCARPGGGRACVLVRFPDEAEFRFRNRLFALLLLSPGLERTSADPSMFLNGRSPRDYPCDSGEECIEPRVSTKNQAAKRIALRSLLLASFTLCSSLWPGGGAGIRNSSLNHLFARVRAWRAKGRSRAQ